MRSVVIKSIVVIMCMALLLSGCGEGVYNELGNAGDADFAIAFRDGDTASEYVTAALKALRSYGTISELAVRWFGRDRIVNIRGDATALEALGEEIPARVFIIGLSDDCPPMSFKDSAGNYTGFDVELAQKVCELLGWELRFMPINPADVKVELQSGNVDCAWGGISFVSQLSGLYITEPYLKNDKVLITLASSGINSTKKLNDRVLGMTFDLASEAALLDNSKLKESLASVIKLNGASACFEALNGLSCDAILIDSVSLTFFLESVSSTLSETE